MNKSLYYLLSLWITSIFVVGCGEVVDQEFDSKPKNSEMESAVVDSNKEINSEHTSYKDSDSSDNQELTKPLNSSAKIKKSSNKKIYTDRTLSGSCRLFFDDDSIKCREIHSRTKNRLISIFKKHCRTTGNGYTGVWSQKECPKKIWGKDRFGGCWSENNDYSTIGYSYFGRDETLAKSLLPLMKSNCSGLYLQDF